MAYEEITSPIALDESFNTTENTSRNIADVLADELSNLADAVKPDAGDIALDTISGMSANNVQDGIEELKQSLGDLNTYFSKTLLATDIKLASDPTIVSGQLRVYQYGHVVIVTAIDVGVHCTVNTEVALTKTGILPKPKTTPFALLHPPTNATTKLQVEIASNGALYSYYTKQTETGSTLYGGQFIYFTDDFTTLAS